MLARRFFLWPTDKFPTRRQEIPSGISRRNVKGPESGTRNELIMGNGYRPGHAEMALQILRESSEIRTMYENKYGAP